MSSHLKFERSMAYSVCHAPLELQVRALPEIHTMEKYFLKSFNSVLHMVLEKRRWRCFIFIHTIAVDSDCTANHFETFYSVR